MDVLNFADFETLVLGGNQFVVMSPPCGGGEPPEEARQGPFINELCHISPVIALRVIRMLTVSL